MDYEIILLSDKERLSEISLLRCHSWESSPDPDVVNFDKYPTGFQDNLDVSSLHFICVNSENQIIGAARLTILLSFSQSIYPTLFNYYKNWPSKRPFILYSRKVVHPKFRRKGIGHALDFARIKYQIDKKIYFGVVTANESRVNSLIQKGWKTLFKIPTNFDQTYTYKGNNYLLMLTEDNINTTNANTSYALQRN